VNEPEVLDALCRRGIVPVVLADELDHMRPLGESLKAGGLPVAEITFRSDTAVDALRLLAADEDLLVGAGTIVTAEQVRVAHAAGARFIVTPGFSAAVLERCRELALAVIPGVATATEVIAALDQGIRLMKFFPAEPAGGTAMLRALAGPFPDVRFIPTGGVSASNAAGYLSLPTVAAVGGSWMVAPALMRSGDFDAISRLAAEAVSIAAAARG
jgi:2-dehydro-3-deoxyphosphogluconate aldolase/(4S)-4-hydroxy-2-oxoglutarate aldolase